MFFILSYYFIQYSIMILFYISLITMLLKSFPKQQDVVFKKDKQVPDAILLILSTKNTSNSEDQFSQVCQHIQQWKINTFQTKTKNAIKQIQNIKFPHLKRIFLGQSKIQSIEVLSKIDLPQLEQLFLMRNNINKINELKKVNWPCFYRLSFHENVIVESKQIARVSFNVGYLSFDFSAEKILSYDRNYIVKAPFKELKNFWSSQFRIKNERMNTVICQRHQKLKRH